jgi:hypothetical protein
MRTGLEPKSSDMFSSIKTTTESSKQEDWLGLKDDSNDEDQLPPHGTQKPQPSVTTFIKKIPIAPIQEAHSTVAEPPKKSVLDIFLEDERRTLTEKTTLTPTVISNNTTQKISKTSSYTDNQHLKSLTKPLFDTKNDSGIFKILKIFNFCSFFLAEEIFKTSKDPIFAMDPQFSNAMRTNSSSVNVSR